jgi:hypothetical protein
MDEVHHIEEKYYEITFTSPEALEAFSREMSTLVFDRNNEKCRAVIKTTSSNINSLIHSLAKYDVLEMSEVHMTLEKYFLQFYKEGSTND